MFNCFYCITPLYRSMSCLTIVLKHKWAEEINSFRRHFTSEKSHYTPKYSFPNITALSHSAETIRDIHSPPISFQFPLWPLTQKSQHQVFTWVNFVQPRSGMCGEKAFDPARTCDKHDSALRGLYRGCFSFSFWPCLCLSHCLTSEICNTYTDSATEWDYQWPKPSPR